jgi:hypothetical protein
MAIRRLFPMTDQGYKARISLDRAKTIADAAVAAGLATAPASDADAYRYSPDLKAKLSELGVDVLLGLNIEQAEGIAAFIENRAGS